MAPSRESASRVHSSSVTLLSGASVKRRRRLNTGSSTQPTVFDNAAPGCIACAWRSVRRRPRKRARSVSHSPASPPSSPTTRSACAAHTSASLPSRRRRVASSMRCASSHAVCTNILENAGCALSAPIGPSTSSAYEVSDSVRVRSPWLLRVSRRSSTSASAATATSSTLCTLWWRRLKRARPASNVTASSGVRLPYGCWLADHVSPLSSSRSSR